MINKQIKLWTHLNLLQKYGLTENAITAAGKIKFKLAIKNGNPVTGIAIVEYNFTIF